MFWSLLTAFAILLPFILKPVFEQELPVFDFRQGNYDLIRIEFFAFNVL